MEKKYKPIYPHRNAGLPAVISFIFLLSLTTLAEKKNVLFIIADDLNNWQGCYGSFVKTPNIDKLADKGTLFERAYCQFPVCGPSRISMMTGMYASRLGATGNHFKLREKWPNIKVLPQVFRENGYWTGRVSKIYHMGIPGDIVNGTAGVDLPESWDEAVNIKAKEQYGKGSAEHLSPKIIHNGTSFAKLEIDEKRARYEADYQAAEAAVKMIEDNKGKPFFIALGFIRPHVPLIAPKRFFDMYPLEKIEAPKDISPQEMEKVNPTHQFYTNQVRYGMNDLQKRKAIQAYAASISFMDEQVGKVLKALEDNGLKEKTIVVFTSDHGYSLGSSGVWQKVSIIEDILRVPLIISVPCSKAQRVNQIVELIDLFPTLCSLTGIETPTSVQGQNLSLFLKNPKQKISKQYAYSISKNIHTLRTDRYRIIKYRDQYELYDLKLDPHQKNNINHQPIFNKFKQQLHKAMKGDK